MISRQLVLMIFMLLASLATVLLKPSQLLADQLPVIELEALIPTSFGEWRSVQMGVHVVDPLQQENINRYYQSSLSRTYVNSEGYLIMLSIAYGRDQTGDLQVHRPEVCYPAQGFKIVTSEPQNIDIEGRVFTGKSLLTQQGRRIEPLIYWSVVGGRSYTSQAQKKFLTMRYALTGVIPDGMLVRISSIDSDPYGAKIVQLDFAKKLAMAIDPQYRERFGLFQ